MIARVYQLTDPDLPAELHTLRDIFLPDKQPGALSGYEQARRTAEKLKLKEQTPRQEQASLAFYTTKP